MAQRPNYSLAALSVVLIAGIVAIVMILSVGGVFRDANVRGLATIQGFEVPPYVLTAGELYRDVPTTVTIGNHEYLITYTDHGVLLDNALHPSPGFSFGDNLYFEYVDEEESLIYFVYNVGYAPSCDGITGQIKELGPEGVCCEGVPYSLPDCSDPDAQPLECGNRFIYCENGRLVAQAEEGQ